MQENEVIFYCRDCETTVKGKKIGNKYVYVCEICSGSRVSFGTKQSINAFYHIKDKN